MDMIIPPLNFQIMLESNPPKSRIFVRRLAVCLMLWLVCPNYPQALVLADARHIYIYIYREREREIANHTDIHNYIYIYI